MIRTPAKSRGREEIKRREEEEDKIMEVILVYPQLKKNWSYKGREYSVGPPMGLLSIASLLHKKGFQVKIIDACVNPDYLEELAQAIDNDPVFVGISAMTAQLHNALQIAEFVRQRRPEIPLVWGGIHPTLFPEQTCQDALVDVVVRGQGEYTALELAEAFSVSKDGGSLSNIRGIAFQRGDEVILTPPRPYSDLNELPFPNYDLLDVERYVHQYVGPNGDTKRTLTLNTGIGCLFRCTFCVNPILFKRRYFGKTAERVLDEIGFVLERYGAEYIVFLDEDFFTDRRRLHAIVKGIQERGYKVDWYANVRASYFSPTYLSDEFLTQLKGAGCKRLAMGVESGSQRVLDEVLKKDIRLEQVERAARLCHKHGIITGYSFMIGVPGETKPEMLKTLQFMQKLKKIHPECYFFGPQVFRPYPGSELYDKCLRYGFEEPTRLQDWVQAISEEGGYFDAETLPWIEDVKFVQQASILGAFFFQDLRKLQLNWKLPLRLIATALARFRIDFDFWAFPLELVAYRFYKKGQRLLRALSRAIRP